MMKGFPGRWRRGMMMKGLMNYEGEIETKKSDQQLDGEGYFDVGSAIGKNRLHNELSSGSEVMVRERRRAGFYVRGDETN